MGTRINKYLAEMGYCSRREADRLIAAGKVRINGRVAKLGDQVESGDDINVTGMSRKEKAAPAYLLFYKPVGLMTTTDTSKKDNVITFIGYPGRIFPVGRLDVASSGLLLLTNDGALANELMHPRYQHEKEYDVRVHKPISDEHLKKLATGIQLEDGRTQPADVTRVAPNQFLITLREGRNRQVRRMCEALDYEVRSLKRIRIAGLTIGALKPGKWRELTPQEIKSLKAAVH